MTLKPTQAWPCARPIVQPIGRPIAARTRDDATRRALAVRPSTDPPRRPDAPVPPITELTRIEPVYLARLEKQGIFTTGLLLEVSETPTRRQYLADHVKATTNDVSTWRDEALMLNLAGFGPDEHQLLIQAGIEGLRDILAIDLDDVPAARLERAAAELKLEPPADLTVETLVGAGADARGRVAPRGRRLAGRRGPQPLPSARWTRSAASSPPSSPASPLALVIVAVSILPFLTPAWVGFEQDRAQAAAWTGFTTAQLRRRDRRVLADLVLGPPRLRRRARRHAGPDRARARPHARRPGRVRGVLRRRRLVAVVALVVAVRSARAGRSRGAGSGGGVAGSGVGDRGRRSSVGVHRRRVLFDAAFELFHQLFFPGGN